MKRPYNGFYLDLSLCSNLKGGWRFAPTWSKTLNGLNDAP